jgi:acetoin utilization deacetylase AcuC-like enzyme
MPYIDWWRYCYFNNAQLPRDTTKKHTRGFVAILDVDFHHGTELRRSSYYDDTVFYVTIHGDPKIYLPWISGNSWEIGSDSGEGFNMNFPLSGGTEGLNICELFRKHFRKSR